jgi:hypothetical protein
MAKISQNLSSNSLYHFVNKLEFLLDILENGFKARYCLENFPKVDIPLAIPMKCFCDIPLGMIKKHLSRYGKFGIGVKKSYAKNKSVTPVHYVHDKSIILSRLVGALKDKDDELAKFVPYFKRYNEKINGNEKQVTRRYYDEREWRYVPSEADFINLRNINSKRKRENKIKSENLRLEEQKDKYRLKVAWQDITFIFVERDSDVDKVIKGIMGIDKNKTNNSQAKLRLVSKIITAERIERDF